MRLTEQTGYALRVLIACASAYPRTVQVSDLAEQTRLPKTTVFKLLKTATRAGLLVTARGRAGGVALGAAPADLSVGRIVRAFEPRYQGCAASLHLETLPRSSPLEVCVSQTLGRGLQAFLREMDAILISDVVEQMPRLRIQSPRPRSGF